jgi:hypothetical protein
MSEIFAGQLTAVANVVLAVFAIVAGVLAGLALKKQSKDVGDQGEMLDLQRRQLEAQREDSARQAKVLDLQAADLHKSLEERERVERERHESQAAGVAAWFAWAPCRESITLASDWGATIRNASSLPVFDVRIFFYRIEEPIRGLGWTPVACGSATSSVMVLPPMGERHVLLPKDVRSQAVECNDSVYTVSIWFTDAAGNRWERDPRGALNALS